MKPLTTLRVGEIPEEESPQRWLIEQLWGSSSVGIIGGCPKLGKSWLGLDMAVSVASATDCLGAFPVADPGAVLVYLAEDALPVLRERVAGLARHRNVALSHIDMHVITEPVLRLDKGHDKDRLCETARRLRPKMILLDPLVRLHSANENDSQEIAHLLSYFRSLQRQLDTSVALVHHSRKGGAGNAQYGQNLRGSGDFWAFGDSNLYLRRVKQQTVLSMEHRAAAAPDPVQIELVATDKKAVHLEVSGIAQSNKQQREEELTERLLALLEKRGPLPRKHIRRTLEVKNERLGTVLNKLKEKGQLLHTAQGWKLPEQLFPVPPIGDEKKGTVISFDTCKHISPSSGS